MEPDATNPLLQEWRRLGLSASTTDVDTLTARYAFAIPTDAALRLIADHSPTGVVELGAGTGYWASLLNGLGTSVVAYDVAPAGAPGNKWFAGSEAWFAVERGDDTVLDAHADRTLLLVWPTRDETWPADALERFHSAGGETVVHVGEGPGGRTGDDRFHAVLGDLDQCLACTYGVRDVVCICGITARWSRVDRVDLPHWPGRHDGVSVYRRRSA